MRSFTSTWIVLKYVISCTSLLLSFNLKSIACGPDFTGYEYTLLLEHYTFNDKFFPYQFDPNSRFYSLSWEEYDEQRNNTFDEAQYNLDAWRSYLNLDASVHDSSLKKFIYQNTGTGIKKITKASAGINNLAKSIYGKKNAEDILAYLLLMNEYKEGIAGSPDGWDYNSYTKTISLDIVNPYIKQCENLIKKTDDEFLQWRLLYLILRASHFNKHHILAISEFEKYYPKFTKDNSLAQYWCEGVYAGALLRTKRDDKAIYYTARAFANCPDKHMDAMNTYLFSNRNWKSALPYCKDAKDSIYVAMLEGANHPMPDMEFIHMVYNANPQSEVLKFLWLREANKIEEYLLKRYERGNYYWNYDTQIDMDSMYKATNTIADFLSLSDQIINNSKYIPAKITIANTIAFYYYKMNDYNRAAGYLEKISLLQKEDHLENVQYQMLSTLITLKKNKEFDAKKFITIIDYFKSLSYNVTNHHIGYYLLYNEMAPWLLMEKDTIAAFWAYTAANCFDADSFGIYAQDYSPESFNHSNFATYLLNHNFTIEQVLQLKKDFINKKGNSELETYLIKQTRLTDGPKLFNLVVARKYMLNEQWDKALDIYPQLPSSYTEQLGPNPANFYINDYIEDDSVQMKKNTYTIKQILDLAQKLKSNTETSAKDKLLYGTLLYNLSFYGKNHYILDNHWNHSMSSTAYFDYDSIDTHLFINESDFYDMPLHISYQNYFHLQTAERYLQQALKELNTDEEKAQCTFLLAKCWQKRCPRKMEYNFQYKYLEDISDYVGNSIKNPYFKNLISLYKNTNMQEKIFNSCSYYRMFLGKK